jgi:hypothetical protein
MRPGGSNEPEVSMSPQTVHRAGLGYVVLLAAVVAGGLVLFRDLFAAPAPEPGTVFAPGYQAFLRIGGGALALLLGLWAGLVGVVHRRWWLGATVLVAGVTITVSAFSILPWVRFPLDRYAAGAAWLFSGLPLCFGTWAVVIVAGWLLRWRAA